MAGRVVAGLRRAKIRADILRNVRPGVECPICGNKLWFWVTDRREGRHEIMCARCGSLERHRRAMLFLRQTNIYSSPLRLLHVAPEPCLRTVLEQLPNVDYVTGDLHGEGVDVALDLTAIAFPDQSFDVIVCSHVLEHVSDDRLAMSEMGRVLRPGGWALVNVPSDPHRTSTYEDATITTPEGRLEHFGQEDHVRVYGPTDLVARLEQAGFDVTVDPGGFTRVDRARYQLDGVIEWEHAYLCRPA